MAIAVRILTLFFLFLLPVESLFEFEDCGADEDRLIRLSSFSVAPDPIDMKGRNITISARGDILGDVPDSANLEVKYYRTRKVFGMQLDLPIPCMLGKYGSCTLPFCEYVARYRIQVCPFLSANQIACECPPKPGTYSGDNVRVELAETSAVGRFIAKGKYRTEMRLKEGNTGKELACFKFYTELA